MRWNQLCPKLHIFYCLGLALLFPSAHLNHSLHHQHFSIVELCIDNTQIAQIKVAGKEITYVYRNQCKSHWLMNLPNFQQIMAWFYKEKKGHFYLPLHRLHKTNAWLSGATGVSPWKRWIANIQSLPCKAELEDKRYSRNCELNWEVQLGLQLVLSRYHGCRPMCPYGYWRSKIWGFGKVPLFQVLHNFLLDHFFQHIISIQMETEKYERHLSRCTFNGIPVF